MIQTMYWKGDVAYILDQVKLPQTVEYIECRDHETVCRVIRMMHTRGAPAIGISASMGIALGAARARASSTEALASALERVYADLLATRPTAVNIKWAVDRYRRFVAANMGLGVDGLVEALRAESQRILDEDVAVNRAIGEFGQQFIKDGARVLTHCNAGSLATGGYGTATAPMRVAVEQGKRIAVFADETRPLLQGARLTTWELMQDGIDVTLITDNSAGALMKRGGIDLAIVGTDRTARNGDVANKIGTYMVAVLCKEHGIPFYVAAPTSSIDFEMASGDEIPIEERGAGEVTNINGQAQVAPEGAKVLNMAFDVTPARYVTAIITEKGAFRPADLALVGQEGADLDSVRL